MSTKKNQKCINELQRIGLSENEAGVYIASLNLGLSNIARVADYAGIKRTTAYSVVESLQNKGLMRMELRGFKKSYRAESPERIATWVENQRKSVLSVIPELEAIYNMKDGESTIKYYNGLESVKNVYLDILSDVKHGDYYYVQSDAKKWFELDEDFFKEFQDKRAKLPLKPLLLLQNSDRSREVQRISHLLKAQTKLLPTGMETQLNIIVTPRKVIIHQLSSPIFAIAITSKPIVDFHKQQFELLWQSA